MEVIQLVITTCITYKVVNLLVLTTCTVCLYSPYYLHSFSLLLPLTHWTLWESFLGQRILSFTFGGRWSKPRYIRRCDGSPFPLLDKGGSPFSLLEKGVVGRLKTPICGLTCRFFCGLTCRFLAMERAAAATTILLLLLVSTVRLVATVLLLLPVVARLPAVVLVTAASPVAATGATCAFLGPVALVGICTSSTSA